MDDQTADGPDAVVDPGVSGPAAGADQFQDGFQQVNRRAGYGNAYRWAVHQSRKGGTLMAGEGALLVARIDELEAQLAIAREDVALLDWLEVSDRIDRIMTSGRDGAPFLVASLARGTPDQFAATLREAIRLAMADSRTPA